MNNSNAKQIKYGSIISYVLILLNILLGLIYTPWILKTVGSSNYGLYTLASSLIALFLMDFGMSAAVTRFISNYRARDNQNEINAFVGLSVKFYIIICFVLLIIFSGVYLNIEFIYKNLTTEELVTFKLVFLISAFFVVACFPVNVCNGILNAYEKYIWLKGSDIFNKLGTVIVTIISLLLNGGILTLVFINGFFNLITFIIKIIIVLRTTPVSISLKTKGVVKLSEIFSFSAWTTVNSISQKFVFSIIPSVLAMVLNTAAIALFGFANVIEGYVYNITEAINGLFLPEVSRIVVNKTDAENVLPLMIKVGRINQSVISLLIIGIFTLGKEFVHLWVGDEYSDLYYCILFLIIPYFVSASQQIGGTSIVVLNKVKYSALIGVVAGLLNIGIAYFIAEQYGVTGVCATIGFISLLRTIANNIVYHKILKINIWMFFANCHIKMIFGLASSTILSWVFVRFIPLHFDGLKGWLDLGLKSMIVTLIYCSCMWIFGWNKYEKSLIRSFFPSKKHSS